MDYYSFGPTRHHIPSKPSDPEIPFFEDAFDTETLKKFFQYQGSAPLISTKYLQNSFMEEENHSQALELISPAATNITNNLLDILHEEASHDFLSQSQSGLNNSLGNLLNPGMGQSHTEAINDFTFRDNRVSASTGAQGAQNNDPQDMIAMICQQLQQQYYTGDSTSMPNLPTMEVPTSSNTEVNQGRKGISKARMMSWQEDSMEPTVLRKLISKKSVFTIQKDVKAPLVVQRKMSSQIEVNKLKAKRKASAPLFMERLNSEMSDVGFESLMASEENKALKVARKNSKKEKEKEKEEKTVSRKNSIFGNSQLSVKVGDMVEKKQDKMGKSKKMVIGNVTVGVKDVANPQIKF